MVNQPGLEAVNMDESIDFPDISIAGCRDIQRSMPTVNCLGRPVAPNFAAAERYAGEWVVPAALGRSHLAVSKGATVRTACGATLTGWFSAHGRAWDGCERCVAIVAGPR
jgi:hypothetical protein